MQGLARGLQLQVLASFRQEAVERKEAALLVYIQQQLEYAKMWKLLEFSQVQRSPGLQPGGLRTCVLCPVLRLVVHSY